jgi:hypothetical protein
MERRYKNLVSAAGYAGIYGVEIGSSSNADEECEHSTWDKLLGAVTMIVVSVGGWTAIIELIRWLR